MPRANLLFDRRKYKQHSCMQNVPGSANKFEAEEAESPQANVAKPNKV